MTFEKGNTHSTGRPKGSKDKKTEQWEIFSKWFMEGGIERLEKEMKTLDPKEFITTMKDLLEYFRPKLARTEHSGPDGKDLFPPITEAQKAELAAMWAPKKKK